MRRRIRTQISKWESQEDKQSIPQRNRGSMGFRRERLDEEASGRQKSVNAERQRREGLAEKKTRKTDLVPKPATLRLCVKSLSSSRSSLPNDVISARLLSISRKVRRAARKPYEARKFVRPAGDA